MLFVHIFQTIIITSLSQKTNNIPNKISHAFLYIYISNHEKVKVGK